MKIGYVYLTTNLINNKKYIGKRTKPYFDKKYLGSGIILKKAIEKYGRDNFSCEVLQWYESEEELKEGEKYWIKFYNAQESKEFYNISSGGDWGDISKGMSPQQYKQWGEKISKANSGKKRTEQQKQNISNSLKGKKRPATEAVYNHNRGKNNPNYGKKWSKEHKQKLSENSPCKKQVKMLFKEEQIFNSVQECQDFLKEKYDVSKFLVKKILKEGTPYKLKGNCKNKDKMLQIEGIQLVYI